MSRKKVYCIVAVAFLVILVVCFTVFLIKVWPKYKGEFFIETYSRQMEAYKLPYTCGDVKNYLSAYIVAEKAIKEQYPDTDFSWYNTHYTREVYYDESSGFWFVYIYLDIENILDGDYLCFISSDGTVVACW